MKEQLLQIQQSEYSGKLIRRLTNVFDSSQIQLVGGEFDGQKAKTKHLLPFLPVSPLSVEDSLGKISSFNTTLPVVAGDLLFMKNSLSGREGYIEGLGGYDVCNLPSLAVMLAQKDVVSQTTIRLVYGATQKMPLRGLSYLLPALVLMEQLTIDRVNPPQLQVVFANNISGRLDGVDISNAREESRRFVEIATTYVAEFFPRAKASTVFLEDTSLDRGTLLRSELVKIAKVVSGQEDIREDLRIKGKNNGSLHTYIFYGAAHLLIHDANLPGSLVPINAMQPEPISPEMVVSFGGAQEKFFYNLRNRIKPFLGTEYNDIKTLQYFTRHRVPPYYMARDGDLSLSDAVYGRSASIGKAASYDLDYLFEISNRRGDFEGFLEGLRGKYNE